MTTRAQQLAMYVVYESPFACVSDSPDAYRGQAGAEFLKVVPTSWDETRVLAGQIGEYIVIARRHGQEWYVGAMTNEQAREIQVLPDFLGGKSYSISGFADGAAPRDVRAIAGTFPFSSPSESMLKFNLASGGGCVLRFSPK